LPVLLLAALAAQPSRSAAQDEALYAGKTIRMVPYLVPGSGTDLQSRFIARYLSKYNPGQPKVIVQNIPGGGGVGRFLRSHANV
jgi:tripartite-type tricarboxylate transporter receptor subunit TctC